MGSDPHAGTAVSTNKASNALRTPYMNNGPHSGSHRSNTSSGCCGQLASINNTTTRTEWFRFTRDQIQSVIADMDLDPDSLSQVEEAFISAGLL